MISLGLQLPLNVVTGILTARMYGPYGRGVLAALGVWTSSISWLLDLSIYQTACYMLSKNRGDRYTENSLLLWAFASTIAIWLTAQLLVYPFLRWHYPELTHSVLRTYLMQAGFTPMLDLAFAVSASRGSFRLYNLYRVGIPFLLVVSLALLCVLHVRTLGPNLYGNAAASFVFWVCALIYLLKQRVFGFSFTWTRLAESLSYGLRIHGASIAGVASSNVATMLLSVLIPTEQLGYISVAQSVSSPVTVVSAALSVTTLPMLAIDDHSASDDRAHRVVRMSRQALTLALILGVAVSIVAWGAVPLMYGSRFSRAVVPAEMLIVGAILDAESSVLRGAYGAAGRPLMVTWSESAAAVTVLMCIWVVGGRFGLSGVAACYLASSLSRLSALLFNLRDLGVPSALELIPRGQDFKRATALLFRTAFKMIPRKVASHE
ncbi:lipopolysaccharide biosynthesis protein [Alicyclobacillus fructus]|uniref:lipopolysaccharide biosynthesis protein n=1 Tax=Alicyclobacillus fructus TaxID=2816082 RepID=UPI0038B35002